MRPIIPFGNTPENCFLGSGLIPDTVVNTMKKAAQISLFIVIAFLPSLSAVFDVLVLLVVMGLVAVTLVVMVRFLQVY